MKDTIKREIYDLKMTTQNIKRIKQKSWKLKVPLVKQKSQQKATPAE
jgi:hypothetical protein